MSIRVISGGLLTTVQDAGRVGYQEFGVPVSGAMDHRAMAVANLLVDNDENEAVLEVTFMGPKLVFTKDNCICITGGDLRPTLDGQAAPIYKAFAVKAGQTLAFIGPKTGCRAYIAFAGGLDLEPAMGSRSTYLKAKIGGYKGRKLDKDDEIAFRNPVCELPRLASRFITPPEYPVTHMLRVVMGPQDDMFTEEGVKTFLSAEYTVTPQADRMGCRLDGEIVKHVKDGNIISDGISFGAVQVPSEGKPIIMLADRQTVGGYTKIATVISADLPAIAQAKPGEKVKFSKVSVKAAQQAYLADKRWLAALKAALALPSAQ